MHSVIDNIEEIVEPGQCFNIVVTGYSMLPLLGYGKDSIVVRRTSNDEHIEGRIAMFRGADRHIIVHRVMKVEGDMVHLQGFGNPYHGEQTPRSTVIGVVESVVRESGKVVSCTTRSWHRRERIWISTPRIVRRYALGIMRRWLNFKRRL